MQLARREAHRAVAMLSTSAMQRGMALDSLVAYGSRHELTPTDLEYRMSGGLVEVACDSPPVGEHGAPAQAPW